MTFRTVAIVQARLGSRRLPGKALYELAGKPVLMVMIERLRRAPGIDAILLATGRDKSNDPLEEVAISMGVDVFRGSDLDVLDRYAAAAKETGADIVARLTGDCPLVDPEVVGDVIKMRVAENLDYCTNVLPPSWPDGLDVSVFTRDTLDRAAANATLPSEREHVVPWMWKHSTLERGSAIAAGNLPCEADLRRYRWTIDSAADYAMLRSLSAAMGPDRLVESGWRDIVDALKDRPDIAEINVSGIRDAGLQESRRRDRHDE